MGPTTSIQALDVSADGRWLAALGRDSQHQLLLLWNVAQLRRSGKVPGSSTIFVLLNSGVCVCLLAVEDKNSIIYRAFRAQKYNAPAMIIIAGQAGSSADDERRLPLHALRASPERAPYHRWRQQHPPVAP